jgi:hypothetical protein
MVDQIKTLSCALCENTFRAPFGISAVCSGPLGDPHDATIMAWSSPTLDHSTIDYDLMAWDVSDALAKSAGDGTIDVGMDAIRPHLPAFIEACLSAQRELDKEENK